MEREKNKGVNFYMVTVLCPMFLIRVLQRVLGCLSQSMRAGLVTCLLQNTHAELVVTCVTGY